MARLISHLRTAKRFTSEVGASLVEYTLLVALIAAVAIGAVTFLGTSAQKTLCKSGEAIAGAPAPADADCPVEESTTP